MNCQEFHKQNKGLLFLSAFQRVYLHPKRSICTKSVSRLSKGMVECRETAFLEASFFCIIYIYNLCGISPISLTSQVLVCSFVTLKFGKLILTWHIISSSPTSDRSMARTNAVSFTMIQTFTVSYDFLFPECNHDWSVKIKVASWIPVLNCIFHVLLLLESAEKLSYLYLNVQIWVIFLKAQLLKSLTFKGLLVSDLYWKCFIIRWFNFIENNFNFK